MVETIFDLNLYEIPFNKSLKTHRAFYGLWRRSDDKATAWLKRVRNCIRHCEYPTITMEFLLFDRFICGLTANELKSIQSVKKSWSLKQLMVHFSNANIDPGHIEEARNSAFERNVNQIESITMDVTKSEPIEENASFSDYADEDEALLSDNERISYNLALDEGDTDHEMAEYEFSVSNFASCEIDEDRQSLLGYPDEGGPLANQDSNSSSYSSDKNDGKDFKCNQCHKSFCHLRNLIKHKNSIYRGIRPFCCQQCGKCFTALQYLTEHTRTHTGERPFACDECNKSFAQHSTLLVHKKGVHQRVRPFSCNQCQKGFISAGELKRHAITHTDERPHICELCGKCFALSSSLWNHKKIVHTQNRPFRCDQCSKSFVLARDLKNHTFTHTGETRPFACDLCDKSFVRACLLDHHKKAVHQLIRPFSCEQCGKCFTSTGDLKKHSKLHERASAKDEND